MELNRHAFCARNYVDETVSWKPV